MLTWSDRFLIALVLIAVPVLMIGVPIYLLSDGLRTFALRPLRRCYEGIALKTERGPGDVTLVYHTYRGFLVWFTQDEHAVTASLLGRLLHFNLTWGMLSYGALFVPLLAIGNYYAQRRLIRQQRHSTS